MKVKMDDDRLTVNLQTGIWKYEFRDSADTVAYTDSLSEMRRLVDWAEANVKFSSVFNDGSGS